LLLLSEAPDTGHDVAARLHRDTGGNPLALIELACEEPSDLPIDAPVPVVTSVAHAYLQRAATLPERTRDALVLAAATDRGDLVVLARAAAAMGIDVADLAPAEQAGLVAAEGARIEFRHPLARSAIYGDASAEQRRAVHRALAGALPDADADRRAWHLALAAAGPDATASSALEQAARRAQERSAYDVASQAFERAALLAAADERRGALLYAAADAAWLGGNAERAVRLLDETTGVAVETVEIEYLRGLIALRRGPLREGRSVLLAAAGRANPEAASVMLAEAAMGAFYAADAAGMLACAEQASMLAARAGSSRAAFLGGLAHGMALVIAGEGELGAASIRDAVQVLESSEELRSDLHVLLWATMCPLWLREADVAAELADRMVETARSRSAVGVLPHLLANLAIQHATTDSWVQAQAESDEAIRLARETGQRVVLAGALARLAWLEARLGREDACRAHAAEALAIAREQGVVLCEIWALTALGELELGLGNADAALLRLEEQQRVIEQQGIGDADLFPAPEQVELYLRLGRAGEAASAAAAFERAAVAKGQPWALARSARCGALLAPDDDFEGRFEEALTLHARTPDLFENARTELAYGARLRRGGQRVRARERLRAAIESFDDLGAAPWAELARAELAATGETARRRRPSSLDELTPQELQVSLLLAEGRTTREAAAALFLSPKTIEYHLRNAYRKLAIHSRDELRDALRSPPPQAADTG
ncbi:MAG: LuxR C-terminal-related transcriptional regulator, partial [Gaiellaceae bacterium]